ncbi:hypothetical protein [Halorussus salinisoli]|uniref:hypothetical protein n=1 Tax=Halorussus salinisoli TaxID=2558242 RepID=UPI00148565BC|nr:hypothetical protein [Halorussus salinisoli]
MSSDNRDVRDRDAGGRGVGHRDFGDRSAGERRNDEIDRLFGSLPTVRVARLPDDEA